MKLCRFRSPSHPWPCVGLLTDAGTVLDLSAAGAGSLTEILEQPDPAAHVRSLAARPAHQFALDSVTLLAPVEQQEVWAAGVTYLRSKAAAAPSKGFDGSVRSTVKKQAESIGLRY